MISPHFFIKYVSSIFLLLFSLAIFAQPSQQKVAHRADFFKETTGYTEPEFLALSPDEQQALYADGAINGHPCGAFTQCSIDELQEKINTQPQPGCGTFNVIHGAGSATSAAQRRFIDVGALQAANPNAVFQVASNFSCLEPASKFDLPENGITHYISDFTQGPFAAISAAPGLVLRRYFCEPVNLLSATALPVTNGYVDFSGWCDDQVKQVADFELGKVKIGWHENIAVPYGFLCSKSEHELVVGRASLVHQVFTSALDLGYASGNDHYLRRPLFMGIAQKLLDAAYLGTVLATAAHGKKKLFLTLIGGGVFKNDVLAIAQAIEKTLPIIMAYGLEVKLVVYDGAALEGKLVNKPFFDKLHEMVSQSGGGYTRHQ